LSFFLQLGDYLNHLKNLTHSSHAWMDNLAAFTITDSMLRRLLGRKEPIELTYCSDDAKKLQQFLCGAVESRDEGAENKKDEIDAGEAVQARYLVEAFEQSLTTELLKPMLILFLLLEFTRRQRF
jgi:hypothetical protein